MYGVPGIILLPFIGIEEENVALTAEDLRHVHLMGSARALSTNGADSPGPYPL
jgi:hypothetical protein